MKTSHRWFDLMLIVSMMMSLSIFFPNAANAVDLTVGSPPCNYATINAAITAASPGDKLLMEGGVNFFENITITKDLALQGGYNGCGSGSSTATTLNGSLSGTVVIINSDLAVQLENLIITNGLSNFEGGGIRFSYGTGGGLLKLTNVDIHSNMATWGGGIWAGDNGQIEGKGVNIYNNTATDLGGGIRLYDVSSATFIDSNVNNNSAVNGAGLSIRGNTSTLNFSGNINNNDASENGGAIHASDGILSLSNITMQSNSAKLDGGAIYQSGGTIAFSGAWSLDNNKANGNGGALAINGTGATDFRAAAGAGSLINNRANGHGGVVYLINNKTIKLYATAGYDLNVLNNHADGNGGAFFADGGGFFDVYGQVVIDGNNALGNGGAFYLSDGSRVWFDDYVNTVPKIRTNWAQNGGAVYAEDSPRVECDGAEFGNSPVGNYAYNGSGGAIYLSNSILNADNCKFYHNKATLSGGAIAAFTSSALIIYASCTSVATILENLHETRSYSISKATPCDPTGGECSSLNNNIADSDNNNTGDGGAIYSSDSSLELRQTYLHHNSAYRGGAIYQTGDGASADVSNCLIHHNTVALAFGAGIRRSHGAFTITHTTMADNIGGSGFSGIATSATNNIAWGNSGYPGFSAAPDYFDCNVDDGGYAGINADPKFTAPGASANYHLLGTSFAIDACATGLETDLENRPRPNGIGYEMGAYEYYRDSSLDPAAMPWLMLLLYD